MSDYFREPKKVRTRPELEKSCRMLREHNEKLNNRIAELEAETAQWKIDRFTARKYVKNLEVTIKRKENEMNKPLSIADTVESEGSAAHTLWLSLIHI